MTLKKHLPLFALILAGAVYVNQSGQHSACAPCAALAKQSTNESAACGEDCAAAVEVSAQPAKAVSADRPAAFVAFDEWAARWAFAVASEQPELVREGMSLAQERRRRMADMMLANPERALELAVPYAVRKSLPAEVEALLEQQVNTMGRLHVAGVKPLPGGEGDAPGTVRWVEVDGRIYEVGTFGQGLNFVTKDRVPLSGIALPADAATNFPQNPAVRPDMIMALSPNPSRELDAAEIADRLAGKQETCPTSGAGVKDHGTPGVVEIGGELHAFCGPAHMRDWATARIEEFALTTPDPDMPVMGAGGDGGGGGANPPVAASGYTEGYKRMLFLRPRFSDSGSALADTIGDGDATRLMNDFIAHMYNMSWGRIRIAPLGPGGSQFTSALVLNKPAADYNNAGLSRLYPDARSAAQSAGYNLGDYDFAAVFTRGRPAAGYAGLAYVGGVGIHIANGYFGLSVFVHEFGHNLGLPHAHTWDTGDNSIIGDGSNVEYGNNNDPMGSGGDSMHYVASHKARLDWIPGNECPRIGSAGVYRLHVCDEPRNGNGLRALRVARSGGLDYWFDYRQNIGGTEFENGLIMHWANTDGNQSYRTDALPKQNGITLPVGRTFTDPDNGVSVTPLRVAGGFPKAMDVAVGFRVAGNRAPVGRIIQHSPHVASGALAKWTVEASDPDGDTLAYYWDFGNDAHSWDNQPVQSKSFGDGEYAIHCVVSDTRGGVWRQTVVQKSGTPSTSQVRISGRVVDGESKPMPGIRVSTDGGLYAWTDSDGGYELCRVPKGVHAVAAMDVVENKLAFSRTFSSGRDWQADTTGADLSFTEVSPEVTTTLVGKLATWKYNDTGTDLGTAWRVTTYNDAAWPQGPGMLGYGNGGEGTVISYGGDPDNKRTTAYFRKKFTVTDPNAFTEIRLRVNRDDAVMVYLNGTKIFQDNFASTVNETNITYATTANDGVEPGTYLQQNGISKSLLVAGDNWLCAEVHQVEPTSSDLAFDAELLGIAIAPAPGAQAAYLSSPEPGALIPSGTASVTLTAEARARTATVTKVEFYVDGAKIGEDTAAPYTATWNEPVNGAHSLHVVANFNIGSPLTSGTVSVTVGTPPATLIDAGSNWKYRASSTAPPANWTANDFNDNAWPGGPAQLGYGDNDEATNISPGGTRYERTQFRRTFNVADPAAVSSMICRLVRDDAAIVYLNGAEAFRHNFDGDTPQAAGVDENGWQQAPIDPTLLRPGVNVIAVEIVQENPNSSDASFDLALEGTLNAPRTRGVYLTSPSSVILPDAPVIIAEAVPGEWLSVTKVEFFDGLVKIGEDTTYPFAFTWSNAPAGFHSITALATDSTGLTFSSFTGAATSVTVRQPAQATTLVKWGDTWKYWDNGTDPGSNWMGRTSFDDTAWPEGSARFGYGGDGEVTSLFVSDAGAKPPTVFFRRKFTVPDPAAYDALRLRVIRDDGVSVQINRTELLRDNLPEGTLTFSTLATAGAADEQTPVEVIVPTTSLRAGENQFTVEVHQNSPNSSDLSFDLELVGLKSPAPAAPMVWLTAPAAGQTILSDSPLPCAISAANLTSAIQRVDYYIGSAKIGQATAAPWAFTWPSALKGTYAVSARASLASNSSLLAAPVTVSVVSPTVTQDLIWSGSDWKYLDTGTAPAAAWSTSTFNEGSWKTGRSRLGFGGDGETTGVTPGHITYWFRKQFTVPAGITLTGAQLRVIRDDGIQLFLNGSRVWLNNLPDVPTPDDLATGTVANADEQTWNTVPLTPASLQPGNNVLAAEIHQSSATSSDVAFDLELSIQWLTPGGLTNTAPAITPIAGIVPAAGDAFNFLLPETAGRIYTVESSVNLNVWTPESTHVTGPAGLSVPFQLNAARKYYRAKWKANP
jgi:hypothetical protein